MIRLGLSKRNYIRIAEILADNDADDKLINDFCEYFREDNERFDKGKFVSFIEERRGLKGD